MTYKAKHHFVFSSFLTACLSAFREALSLLPRQILLHFIIESQPWQGLLGVERDHSSIDSHRRGLTLKPCNGDFNKYVRNIIDEKSSTL